MGAVAELERRECQDNFYERDLRYLPRYLTDPPLGFISDFLIASTSSIQCHDFRLWLLKSFHLKFATSIAFRYLMRIYSTQRKSNVIPSTYVLSMTILILDYRS